MKRALGTANSFDPSRPHRDADLCALHCGGRQPERNVGRDRHFM